MTLYTAVEHKMFRHIWTLFSYLLFYYWCVLSQFIYGFLKDSEYEYVLYV
jgi:hypothetical protein